MGEEIRAAIFPGGASGWKPEFTRSFKSCIFRPTLLTEGWLCKKSDVLGTNFTAAVRDYRSLVRPLVASKSWVQILLWLAVRDCKSLVRHLEAGKSLVQCNGFVKGAVSSEKKLGFFSAVFCEKCWWGNEWRYSQFWSCPSFYSNPLVMKRSEKYALLIYLTFLFFLFFVLLPD